VSDHFDGERFRNQVEVPHGRVGDFLRWRLSKRETGDWTPPADVTPGPPPPARVGAGALRATFVNHATVLLQLEGLNVLTDPVYSERVSPVSWAGPKRVRPPGVRFEDLPAIDLVLISHSHYDHIDLPTLARLKLAHPQARYLVPLGDAPLLVDARYGVGLAADRVSEHDWWDAVDLADLAPGVRARCVPAQHFANRGLADRDATLWCGWVLETAAAGSVYFAGDTGWGPHFEQVRARCGPPRLALLPIGAYEPRWFMQRVHVNPDEAVQAHLLLEAATSLAIHFGTFRLSDEGREDPPRALAAALAERGVAPGRFWVLREGEGRDAPAVAAEVAARESAG
jgi:L-ascorbate metabolism protein UlaG (beta-lactamase superfamily)